MSETTESFEITPVDNAYAEATDCPICPMLATDRDDALAEVEAMKRGFEEMAAKVADLRAQVARHRAKRIRQIAHTKRWRAEAKGLRRLLRIKAGERFDDPATVKTWSKFFYLPGDRPGDDS